MVVKKEQANKHKSKEIENKKKDIENVHVGLFHRKIAKGPDLLVTAKFRTKNNYHF